MPDPTRKTVSSTEASALFGLSPYITEFMLYQRLAGGPDIELPENERMKWGHLLQPVILKAAAEELRLDVIPWDGTPHYVSRGPLGATLDGTIRCPTRGQGIVEAKSVAWLQWRQNWIFDDNDECVGAPAHIEIQVQVAMWAARANWGVIAVLVGGNELVLLERRPDRAFWDQLCERAASMLERVRGRNAPAVVTEEDLGVLDQLCPTYPKEPPRDLTGTVQGDAIAACAMSYADHRRDRIAAEKLEKSEKATLLLLVQALAEEGDPPGVIFTDDGTLKVVRVKDTLYDPPTELLQLLILVGQWMLSDGAEVPPSVREAWEAAEALRRTVAKKGGLRVYWKPVDSAADSEDNPSDPQQRSDRPYMGSGL